MRQQTLVQSVIEHLVDDRGSMLPLMLGFALFASSLALTQYASASYFAFCNQVQFYADQLALSTYAANTENTSSILRSSGFSKTVQFASFEAHMHNNEASVKVCQVWSSPAMLSFVPSEKLVCAESTAR